MQIQPEMCARLVERGCLVQINAPSLRKEYGRTIARIAADLIRRELVHIVASDAHNATYHPPVLSKARRAVVQATDEDAFHRMTQLMPAKLIRNAKETAI